MDIYYFLENLPLPSEGNIRHLIRYRKFITSIYNKRKIGIIPEIHYEKHHVFPKSMLKTSTIQDDQSNLILLTYREHFIAHLILWKCYSAQMATALHYMRHTEKEGVKLNSTQVENLKKDSCERAKGLPKPKPTGFGEIISLRVQERGGHLGENNPMFGKHHSEESNLKNSQSQKELYDKGYINPSQGKTGELSPILGEKNGMFGKQHSDESKNKMSLTRRLNKCNVGSRNGMAQAVYCVELKVKFDTKTEASKKTQQSLNDINKSIKHNKSIKGFTWLLIKGIDIMV